MACKITKRTEHRAITSDEFKKQKGYGDFKFYRQVSKAINFSAIFGAAGSVVSQFAVEPYWTSEQVEEYIKSNNLEGNLEDVQKRYRSYTEEHQKCIVCGDNIREMFFEGYPGLLERCDREVKYATENGFIRSYFGMTRNFIELKLRGEFDDKVNSARMRNLENQAKNVLAQQMEACIRGRAMREIAEWLIDNGYKSRVWNEIHDSIDYFLHKDEVHDVLAHVKHVEERVIPELKFNWVPLPADCEIADLKASSHNYYKGGSSPDAFGVKWENLEYEDPDPFCVELDDELELEYFKKRESYWKSKGEEDPLKEKIKEHLNNKKTS